MSKRKRSRRKRRNTDWRHRLRPASRSKLKPSRKVRVLKSKN